MLTNTLIILLLACSGVWNFPTQENDFKDTMHKHRVLSTRTLGRAEETDAGFWTDMAQATLADHISRRQIEGKAKNVIMFLGDGMSIPTLTAARIFAAGEQHSLVWENFPNVGLSKTYCVDAMVADSACSATAYLGGVKGNTATIGVTAAVKNKDCIAMRNTSNHVQSVLRKAQLAGKSTGIVTSTRITHASPSGAYAHVAERDWETDQDIFSDGQDPTLCDDIAEQLIRGETGKNLKVILAGGRSNFRPSSSVDEEGAKGRRGDGVDLIAEWQAQKTAAGVSWAWAWDRNTLQSINFATTDYIFGLFEPGHLEYHLDNNEALKPTLVELTRTAISSLSRDPNGYVLFIEGGRIDHAHHDTRAYKALDETLQFEEAVRAALDVTDPQDTLIVVTADHAHTMSLAGYPNRGSNVLGISEISTEDGLPYSVLSYANGLGYKHPDANGNRYDITNDNMGDKLYRFPSLAPLDSETHGGDDVAVFALGPWAHLLTGTYEQNFIEHVMSYASCVGSGLSACTSSQNK